jgi:hypothetical protein
MFHRRKGKCVRKIFEKNVDVAVSFAEKPGQAAKNVQYF